MTNAPVPVGPTYLVKTIEWAGRRQPILLQASAAIARAKLPKRTYRRVMIK